MAYSAVIAILCTLIFCVFMMLLVYSRDLRKEYLRGWDDAQRIYTDFVEMVQNKEREMRERDLEEQKARAEEVAKENNDFFPVTSDMLMAHGVSRVGDLPKKVLEAYNISDRQRAMDIDMLMSMEKEERTFDI